MPEKDPHKSHNVEIVENAAYWIGVENKTKQNST